MTDQLDLNDNAGRIVYVKPVAVADLPSDMQEEIQEQTGITGTIYSVHDADGQQLALVADRQLAFQLAQQHDYAPVAVH